MEHIAFTKVNLPFGWLGNMSPFPIVWDGDVWRTSEALFQALRFDDLEIREEIRMEKSPMGAKMKARSKKDKMKVEPLSGKDLDNMRMCIRLKLEQHPDLKNRLIETGSLPIYEDVTKRPRGSGLFWGAKLTSEGWVGENYLGKIWMEHRDRF